MTYHYTPLLILFASLQASAYQSITLPFEHHNKSCPILTGQCLKNGFYVGDIYYASQHYQVIPSCKAVINEEAFVQQCQNTYPQSNQGLFLERTTEILKTFMDVPPKLVKFEAKNTTSEVTS